MRNLLAATCATLLGGGALSLLPCSVASEAVPVPGPGGVAAAVRDFLGALDDGVRVDRMLSDDETSIVVAFGENGDLGKVAAGTGVSGFVEVDFEGRPIIGDGAETFARALAAKADSRAEGAREQQSELGALRVSCDSERCSWAAFEFVRTYTHGEYSVRVPMHGTALLGYSGGGEPRFRIYRWHVSRAGMPSKARK